MTYFDGLLGEYKSELLGCIAQSKRSNDRRFQILLDICENIPEDNEGSQKLKDIDYLNDMVDHYLSFPESLRHDQMALFADNHQVDFGEVKEILGYLGLELEPDSEV